MKITALLMFLVCINLASALTVSLGVFINAPNTYESNIIETLNESFYNQSYQTATTSTLGSILQGGSDFITAFYIFTKLFVKGVLLPQVMLENFGVPYAIALYFSYPIYLIYLIGIIQFLSGRFIE